MFEYRSNWLCFCAVVLQGVVLVLGQFGTMPKPQLSVRPSFFRNTGNLGPNTLQNNENLDMFAQRQYYNTLMGRIMQINNSKLGNTNRNNINVDEIAEWKFTDPHNLVDAWAPPSGKWLYLGDWKESDRSRFNDVAPARAERRTNTIKYFFRRGILFSPKMDGTDVPRQVHTSPIFHSRPVRVF